jgi:hypothetical protein
MLSSIGHPPTVSHATGAATELIAPGRDGPGVLCQMPEMSPVWIERPIEFVQRFAILFIHTKADSACR